MESSLNESDVNMHMFSAKFHGGSGAKTAILRFMDFSKSKSLRRV